jgi:hypothetical protein
MAKLTGSDKTELRREVAGRRKFVIQKKEFKTRTPEYRVMVSKVNGSYKILHKYVSEKSAVAHFELLVKNYRDALAENFKSIIFGGYEK